MPSQVSKRDLGHTAPGVWKWVEMLALWFIVCYFFIIGASLLIVGSIVAFQWTRSLHRSPHAVAPSLIALTGALLPDLVMFVNVLTGLRIIHVIPNHDNALLFSGWQIVSGILILLAISLHLAEGKQVNRITFWGSVILLVIHGAGTALFFYGIGPFTIVHRDAPLDLLFPDFFNCSQSFTVWSA